MFKRLLAAALTGLFLSGVAFANNLPLITGAQDPSQLNATINTLIQSINANTTGLVGSYVTSTATTGTSIQALGTVTIAPNLLSSPGQALRIKCWGTGTATGTNTLTLQYGTATVIAVAGGATTAGVFSAEAIVLLTGSKTEDLIETGIFNATPATSVHVAATQDNTTSLNAVCSGTSTTLGNFTLTGMTVEQLK
jgi:hypothetical protein